MCARYAADLVTLAWASTFANLLQVDGSLAEKTFKSTTKALFGPSTMRVYAGGDIEDLNNPVSTWDSQLQLRERFIGRESPNIARAESASNVLES
jgi:hypothetical protein